MVFVSTMKIAITLLAVAMFVPGAVHANEPAGQPQVAGRANLRGVVHDARGVGVPDVDLLLLHEDGAEVARATTTSDGDYAFGCVDEGAYHLTLDPKTSGLVGRTVVARVGPRGLAVSWTAGPDKPALAQGSPQGGACGEHDVVITPPLPAGGSAAVKSSNLAAIGSVSGVIAAGGTLGGLAATGAFDGSNSGGDNRDSPASPIQ
jgi:hypothetical protein